MKILKKSFEKDGGGTVSLLPDEDEDMWHVFNLVSGDGTDRIKASTVRKVQHETASGGTDSQRVRLTLEVVVENVDFDAVSCKLRLRGKNILENPHVKLGSYHTIELEKNRKFTLTKECFDAIHIEVMREASDPTAKADVAAVVMQEGLAHICLITSQMTHVRQKIEQSVPRKGKAAIFGHDKAVKSFYEKAFVAMRQHVDFEMVKCVVIASPGFVKDEFLEYVLTEGVRRDARDIIEHKSKFLCCHASSGHKHSLQEALADPGVAAQLSDTKAAGEVRALSDFNAMMSDDPDRAYYGPPHVKRAAAMGAIHTLLILDELFRSTDVTVRKQWVTMTEEVEAAGGKVFVFSSMHLSGSQLKNISGVAALLRFPMPEIEEEVPVEDHDLGSDDDWADSTIHSL